MSGALTIKQALRLTVTAATNNMRANGREDWSEADWGVALEVSRRLLPLIDGDEDVERQRGDD